MKNLFDPVLVQETERRIQELTPESGRQWGSMGVAQALAHCTAGINMAMGTLPVKPKPLPARVLGKLIKPMVFRDDAPMRRDSPSAPELFSGEPDGLRFRDEQSRLVSAIGEFAARGAAGCAGHPHPFFGALDGEQWAILMYKHVDHHLRQFGV